MDLEEGILGREVGEGKSSISSPRSLGVGVTGELGGRGKGQVTEGVTVV